MLYQWLVFVHLAGVFGFLLAHGISVSVAFGLRRERDPRSVALLLRLSSGTRGLMYGSLALLLGGGVAAGFAGSWWRMGWIWTALALLVVLVGAVLVGAMPYFRRLRRALAGSTGAAGDASGELGEAGASGKVRAGDALPALLASPVPLVVAGVGGIALLAILYLMVFKPF